MPRPLVPRRLLRVGAAVGRARFVCPDCSLSFPRRRAADPRAVPLRCLCCEVLRAIPAGRELEVTRRILARSGLRRRLGGQDVRLVA